MGESWKVLEGPGQALGRLDCVLEAHWGVLKISRGVLKASFGCFGRFLTPLEDILGVPGRFQASFWEPREVLETS